MVVPFNLFVRRVDGDGRFFFHRLNISFILAFLQACTSISCICTSAIATSIQACVNCDIGIDPSVSAVASAQSLIDSGYPFLPSIFPLLSLLWIIHAFSFLAFETACASVTGIPSVTINTNPGAPQSTPTAIVPPQSTAIVPSQSTAIVLSQPTIIIPATTISQIVIGPSSTTSPSTEAATSVGSTSTASIGGLPLKSSASPNMTILHWIGALIGLAAWNLLVF